MGNGIDRGNHHLRYFDVQTRSWQSVSNCPSMDPNKWDVEGNLCAFVHWGTGDWKYRDLEIVSLPGCETIMAFSATSLVDRASDTWQGITDMKISPDRSKIAVLLRVADAVAYKDGSSYYDLGSKCKLLVLEIGTGRTEMTTASRWASDYGLLLVP